MRYLSSPALERYEAEEIPAAFGKHYSPGGAVALVDDAFIDAPGLDMPLLDGETLAIAPDTVSWTFLTRREAAAVASLAAGERASRLRDNWPCDALGPADEFVARLFRRGVVRLNGETTVDPTIFQESANYREGHLVELLLTEKCNLACGYCLAGAAQRMPHMSDQVAQRTVDLAYAINNRDGFAFEFSGGEPFLRYREMKNLVNYIRNHPERNGRSAHIRVQTNCTLLDEERVAWLRDNEIGVGLSMDGNPWSHNQSRPQVNGRESFTKVMRGLDLLQRAGISFGVLIVLNRSNVGSVESLVDFLIENGVRNIKLNPVAYLGDARSNWDALGLHQDEVIAYFQTLAKYLVELNCDIFEANLFDMTRHLVSKQRHSRCLRGHCGAGDSFSVVAADGSIFPCGRSTQSPDLKLGSVLTETHSLNAPALHNPHIQAIRARRPHTLEDCATCTYRELCQAGCSAQAFERYGTVMHKTPECAFNKTMYPFLMRWLSFDERAVAYFNRSYFREGGSIVIRRRQFLPD